MSDPNWAEQVTAISTAIGSIGLLSTLGLAIFAGLQVREAQHARHAQLAADFLRRWDEDALVETRRLVAQYANGDELATAFHGFLASNSVSAYVLLRELDFFEQLGALEAVGAFDFALIRGAARGPAGRALRPVEAVDRRDGCGRVPAVRRPGGEGAPGRGPSRLSDEFRLRTRMG